LYWDCIMCAKYVLEPSPWCSSRLTKKYARGFEEGEAIALRSEGLNPLAGQDHEADVLMNEACDLASLARPRWRFYRISPRQQPKLIYPPQFRSRHFLRLSHPPQRLDGLRKAGNRANRAPYAQGESVISVEESLTIESVKRLVDVVQG